ncbi:MAG: hypothetical protein GY847_07615 [Proteobacteria bacterium]|nr:hypothetical protein [Pseudomonadota bacterium]
MSTALSPDERREQAFKGSKTWGLMALAEGKSEAVDRGPEDTVMTWPKVVIAEMTIFMAVLASTMILSILFDAPLKEIADPAVPENPAKAPWYFLGLQELVGYSAFMGGVAIPGIVLLGLALIPYLDREKGHIGVWFSSGQGAKVAFHSAVLSFIVTAGIVAVTVEFGWLRNWFPDINQLAIIAINPGTIIVGTVAAWSIWIIRQTRSSRMGAIALFTFFLVSFATLTYIATFLRGPNWEFYWSSTDWPGLH